jgi:hypothetical protein
MSFADSLALEIDRAHVKHLDYLARQLWAAHANGTLDDATAQGLAETLRERQRVGGQRPGPQDAPAAISVNRAAGLQRRPPRSPDRQRSLERRRRLSAAGMMPPGIALKFTVGERAALYVVATEVKRRGQCDLYVDQIAAFAGVGRSTCKNALRMAKRLGLITVDERRIGYRYNDANRVRIVSKEWLAWLAHGQKETVNFLTRTTNQDFKRSAFSAGLSVSGRQTARLPVGKGRESGYPEDDFASAVPRVGPNHD